MAKSNNSNGNKQSGGSTLKRLKSNLKSLGLIGKQKISKRKHAKLAKGEKEERVAKLKKLQDQVNPFELKFNRKKHEVLGRKEKGVVGKPGASRKTGIEVRKKSLLVEYKNKDKVGEIIDRRFGENDANMTVEDKMLERFMVEKKKKSRSGKSYNLESDEEELTHFGQSLSKLTNISEHDPRLDDGEEGPEGIRGDMVHSMHFGGFEDEDEENGNDKPKKSHADIMQEIIAKSKFHKFERQKAKEENEELRKQLNDSFPELRQLLFGGGGAVEEKREPRQEPDDYDKTVKELIFDKKAKPSNRLKTEEELAKEEAEKLMRLEKKRLRRMQGLPSDSEGSDYESEGEYSVHEGGDNLDGNYELIEGSHEADLLGKQKSRSESQALVYQNGKLANPEAITIRKVSVGEDVSDEDDDSEEYGSEEEGTDEEESEEEESEEETGDVSEDGSVGEEEEVSVGEISEVSECETFHTANDRSFIIEQEEEQLPFTFSCPKDYSKLVSLLKGHTTDEQLTIIDRIIVLTHPSLAKGNNERLQTLMKLLVRHFESICRFMASPTTQSRSNNSQMDQIAECCMDMDSSSCLLPTLQLFVDRIWRLVQKYPTQMTELGRQRIQVYHRAFNERPVSLPPPSSSSSNSQVAPKPLIRLHEVMFVRLLCKIYATSDFYHPVISAVYPLCGEWLTGLCRRIAAAPKPLSLSNFTVLLQDVSTGLFLSQIILEAQQDSKRFFPEVLTFLYSLLSCFFSLPADTKLSFPDYRPEGKVSVLRIDTSSSNNALGVERDLSLEDALLGRLVINKETINSTLVQLSLITIETMMRYAQLNQSKEAIESSKPLISVSADALDDDETAPATADLRSLYTSVPFDRTWGWIELFDDFIAILQHLNTTTDSLFRDKLDTLTAHKSALLSHRLQTCERLGFKHLATRVPLQWQKVKPKAISMFTPRIEQSYNLDRHYDPDPVRSEAQKVKALHKREMKGALRELRKDSAFLAGQKLQAQLASDKEYQTKIKRVFGMLSAEQGEMKREKRIRNK